MIISDLRSRSKICPLDADVIYIQRRLQSEVRYQLNAAASPMLLVPLTL